MTRDIEEKYESLAEFLQDIRLEKIGSRLKILGIDSIAALATLNQRELNNMRAMLKPVEVKRFEREIVDKIAPSVKVANAPESQPASAATVPDKETKTRRTSSPVRQSLKYVDVEELYSPDDCYLNYSAEQLLVMIDDSTHCINMLNSIIAKEPCRGINTYSYCDYTSNALSRMQASKESHIERLRLLRRVLDARPTTASEFPIYPPPIPRRKDRSTRVKRKLRFDPTIPDGQHVDYRKDKAYAKKLHEEDLKKLRDAERQRFAALENDAGATTGWNCRICKQTNASSASSCKDCKEPRYRPDPYSSYTKSDWMSSSSSFNRTYGAGVAASSVVRHTPSYSYGDYYSSTPSAPNYYNDRNSTIGMPCTTTTSLRGSAIQRNGPVRSQPLRHFSANDSSGMKNTIEMTSQAVTTKNPAHDISKTAFSTNPPSRPSSPTPYKQQKGYPDASPYDTKHVIAQTASPGVVRASTPSRSITTSKPVASNRSSSTGRMGRPPTPPAVTRGRITKWGM